MSRQQIMIILEAILAVGVLFLMVHCAVQMKK